MDNHTEQLDHFFEELSRRWTKPVRLLITGAWAVAACGYMRPTKDVDFEVQGLKGVDAEPFDIAARQAGEAVKLVVQYSTDIDRWSSIVLLDYREHTHAWKRFGSIDVHVLDPRHWSIGKLHRFIDTDIQDMIHVFQASKPDPLQLAAFWLRAIKASPPSSEQWVTKRHAQIFFKQYGREIWGNQLPSEKIEQILQ